MRIIATLQADLETTSIGTRSRLADEIHGSPVLRRTVERVGRATGVAGIHVLCPQEQRQRVARILEGLDVEIHPFLAQPPPWLSLAQTARKWSLDAWRGGIGGTTSFDEFVDARMIAGVPALQSADAVLVVPPAAPLIDPGLMERMIQHRAATREDSHFTFTQAPPGVAGIILDREFILELAERQVPLGWVFAYQPDQPLKDMSLLPCLCEIPARLRYCSGRLIADTRRSFERIQTLLTNAPEITTDQLGGMLSDLERSSVDRYPREVEIELTTEDPFPKALLHPRGDRVSKRGPIDPALVARIAAELANYDDSLVVLGGFGDPLRHPRFAEVLGALRSGEMTPGNVTGEVYGLCVRTTAVDLTDEAIDALIRHRVDVLNVVLDAWTPDLYHTLQGDRVALSGATPVQLEAVLGRLQRLADVKRQRQSVRPIVVPEFTKARENVHELDDFHDGWLRRVGAVLVRGYTQRAGQMPDRRVMSMAPPQRTPCRRIRSRCLVLADARMTCCDQDFAGRHCVGDLHTQTLADLWKGAGFQGLRALHNESRYHDHPLCDACDEWHRP